MNREAFEAWKAWYSECYTSFIPMHEGELTNLEQRLSFHTWCVASQAQQPTQDNLEVAKIALRKLACLGNGDTYGNSIGNQIAIDALMALTTQPSASQAQQSQWISVEEAKATLKDGDLIFAYCEFYGVIEATYAFEEGYYNPHRIVKKNGDSYRINTFTHFMVRKPTSLPPAPEGGE